MMEPRNGLLSHRIVLSTLTAMGLASSGCSKTEAPVASDSTRPASGAATTPQTSGTPAAAETPKSATPADSAEVRSAPRDMTAAPTPVSTQPSGVAESMPVLPSLPSPDELPPLSTPVLVPSEAPTTEPVPDVIKPELSEAFNTLFEPALSEDKWELAHQKLIESGAESVPLLRKEMGSLEVARREQASSILVLLGADARPAIPALLKSLEDESAFVKANAAASLASFAEHQPRAKQVLLKLLDSSEPDARRMAASNLSLLGDAASDLVPRLTLALDDRDEEVVRPIVQLLGEIGAPARSALPRLQQIAFEQQGDIKDAAKQAVQLIEGKNP